MEYLTRNGDVMDELFEARSQQRTFFGDTIEIPIRAGQIGLYKVRPARGRGPRWR